MQRLRQSPILILLLVNILVGLFTFRNYGLSWDEPLFYNYADALRYAYSPKEWFSGHFDLNNAFGISASDHENRGPAYLILAHPFESAIEALGADSAAAWHLINFLTFQLGVYLLYRFSKRFVSQPAALATAALFAWQPLLWGHAFINPKDPPFLVFFLGAVCFGFEFVDSISSEDSHHRDHKEHGEKLVKGSVRSVLSVVKSLTPILLAGFFLGVATSIRVLGPLAAIFVGIYGLSKIQKITLPTFIKYFALYAVMAIFIMFVTWPYLWSNPLRQFITAFGFMSDNPTHLPVLFNGQTYEADQLPRRYLPTLLTLTLTEPALILSSLGLFFAFAKKKSTTDYLQLFTIFLWFLIPFTYVILRKPPMYDGYRHFLFMLPPIFIFAGFAFDKFFEIIQNKKLANALAVIILLPAIYSMIQLHPYEYAYYNMFVGGTNGAFRTYETEYWLTCYKEAVENFTPKGVNLFIKREPYIAAYYASDINIRDYRAEFGKIKSGDYVLVNSRTNEDIKTFRDTPIVLKVSRGDAVFCEVKQVP